MGSHKELRTYFNSPPKAVNQGAAQSR